MQVLSNIKLNDVQNHKKKDLKHKDSIKSDIELNNDYCDNI